jgi:hypothetical protein
MIALITIIIDEPWLPYSRESVTSVFFFCWLFSILFLLEGKNSSF